uniref:Uncharacterized protein n=1 Tax=Anopheles coluzzii TaxID=1518534 RepID=A0A8W7PVC9_ANOCL
MYGAQRCRRDRLSVNVSSIEPDRTGDQWGLAGISSARAQLHSLDADRAKAYNNNSSKQQVQTGTRKMKQRDTRSSEGHMNEHVRNTSAPAGAWFGSSTLESTNLTKSLPGEASGKWVMGY